MKYVAGSPINAAKELRQSHQLGNSKGRTSAERLMSATEGELYKSTYHPSSNMLSF